MHMQPVHPVSAAFDARSAAASLEKLSSAFSARDAAGMSQTNPLEGRRPIMFDPPMQPPPPDDAPRLRPTLTAGRLLSTHDLDSIAREIRAEVLATGGPLDSEQAAPGGKPGPLTDEMIGRYLSKLDIDGDTVVSAKEAPFGDALFGMIDADGDGAITGSELFDAAAAAFEKAAAHNPSLSPEAFLESFLFAPAIDASALRREAAAQPRPEGAPVVAEAAPVSAEELTSSRRRGAAVATDDGRTFAGRPSATAEPSARELQVDRPRLQQIAERIAARLEQAGHLHRPPANIQALMAELGLGKPASGFVMQMLAARFPQGLGLSVVG